jgi:hypothetical protein
MLAGGLDVFEHDHAALFEYVIELPTHRFVGKIVRCHAANACTERQTVLQLSYVYRTHLTLPRGSP